VVGSGCGLFCRWYPGICLVGVGGRWKPRNTSVRIVSMPTDVRTGLLPKISQKRCCMRQFARYYSPLSNHSTPYSVTDKWNKICHIAGFEVLTAVIVKSSAFWDITPCSPLKDNRRCGGTYRLHLQGQRINSASCWFLAWLILRLWRRKRYVPRKRRFAFNGLHGITSQKTELFKFAILINT
jgi:hypothetical protein